jgi:excisionase family DNA binding protein
MVDPKRESPEDPPKTASHRGEPAMGPLALSVAQAALVCDLSERTLRNYIKRGELKVSRAGRRILIRPQCLEAFLVGLEAPERMISDEPASTRRRQP